MPFAWLWTWLRSPSARRRGGTELILYTRHGCHLCTVAGKYLRRERRRYGYRLTVVDVDADPGLVQKYGDCVPVVIVNGKVRFRGAVNPVLFRRLMTARRAGSC